MTDAKEFFQEMMADSEVMRTKHGEMIAKFDFALLDRVRIFSDKESALRAGHQVISTVLNNLQKLKIDYSNMEPGHGAGHLRRDYINALILFGRLEASPRDIFFGFICGSLHDLGTAIIDRYSESKRVIRHAEAGAMLVDLCLDDDVVNEAERVLIYYVIAAHTHYLRTIEIKDEKGQTVNKIEPYTELYPNGQPFWPVWFARWVDRLDCSGPCFVGRHYLTLAKKHDDFDGKNFYDVSFDKHMRPLLRDKPDDGNTMVEHLRMFANSQTNQSPYGKHDYGFMIEMRTIYREMLLRVVNSFKKEFAEFFDAVREGISNDDWGNFLNEHVEFSQKTEETTEVLGKMFDSLPVKTRMFWSRAFDLCLEIYTEEYKPFVRKELVPYKDMLVLPILGDVSKRI